MSSHHAETATTHIPNAMIDILAPLTRKLEQDGFPRRDLVLEAYFARWQSVARYQLAASDSETLSLVELVAIAEEEDRRRSDFAAGLDTMGAALDAPGAKAQCIN